MLDRLARAHPLVELEGHDGDPHIDIIMTGQFALCGEVALQRARRLRLAKGCA